MKIPTASMNGHEVYLMDLTVTAEEIDVTPLTESAPDPKWTYLDLCGHFHAFSSDGTLPTLEKYVVGDSDHEDSWPETFHRCRICKEIIEPLYQMIDTPRIVPGRVSWEMSILLPEDIRYPHNGQVSMLADVDGHQVFGIGACVSAVASGNKGSRRVLIRGLGALGKRDA